MNRHALLKNAWKGAVLLSMAVGAAAQNTAKPLSAQKGFVPDACLAEIHNQDSDREREKEFLKAYHDKYGKHGRRQLILTVELPFIYQPFADTYFKSKRTLADERNFWFMVSFMDNYGAPLKSHEADADFYMKEEDGKQRRGLLMVSAYAYDLGYNVQFVDDAASYTAKTSLGGIKSRNESMGHLDAMLALNNRGGLVALNGAAHDTDIWPTDWAIGTGADESTIPAEMAKQGVPCTPLNVSESPIAGETQVEKPEEFLSVLKTGKLPKVRYSHSRDRLDYSSSAETTQSR